MIWHFCGMTQQKHRHWNRESGRKSDCNYISFTKSLWAGDSEGTFRSLSQAATCPTVYHTRWRLRTVPFNDERQIFYSLWFDQTENQTQIYQAKKVSIYKCLSSFSILKIDNPRQLLSFHKAIHFIRLNQNGYRCFLFKSLFFKWKSYKNYGIKVFPFWTI